MALKKNTKSGGRAVSSKILFQSDENDEAPSSGETDMDGDGEYNSEYERTRRALEAELTSCSRCGPKDLLCLIDKHGKHRKVTAMMLRTWVLALVCVYLFLAIILLLSQFVYSAVVWQVSLTNPLPTRFPLQTSITAHRKFPHS